MLINGVQIKEAIKPQKLNSRIQNSRYAAAIGCELPEETARKWAAKGFIRVDDIARNKMSFTGMDFYSQFVKVLWHLAFNGPKVLVLRTGHLRNLDLVEGVFLDKYIPARTKLVKGLITHTLFRGGEIRLDDRYSGIKTVLNPVPEEYMFQNQLLFKTKQVETLSAEDIAALSPSGQETAALKLRILQDARAEYMRKHVFPWVNTQLESAGLLEFYRLDRAETAIERLKLAWNYQANDALTAVGATLTVNDLYANPQIIEAMRCEVGFWAGPLDLPVKRNDGVFTIDSIKPNHWYKHRPGYVHTLEKELMITCKIKMAMEATPLPELILLYEQVQFYKQVGIEQFLAPDWALCPECGLPNRKSVTNCDYCGLVLDNGSPMLCNCGARLYVTTEYCTCGQFVGEYIRRYMNISTEEEMYREVRQGRLD
jgi:hypothetical protein